jgi:hypothetical protein
MVEFFFPERTSVCGGGSIIKGGKYYPYIDAATLFTKSDMTDA